MKIRNGFVGNSSSSSFIAVIKEDVADEVMDSLTEFEKHVVNKMTTEKTVFHSKCIVYSVLSIMDSNPLEYEDFDESLMNESEKAENDVVFLASEAIDKLIAKSIEIDENAVFTNSEAIG